MPVRSMTSSWARIWQPLRDALPHGCYRDGSTMCGSSRTRTASARPFNDGTGEHGDLLIGADGPLSTGPFANAAGSQARQRWRICRLARRRGTRTADPQLRADARQMVFGLPEGELMLSIPMPAQIRAPQARPALPFHLVPPVRATVSDILRQPAEASRRRVDRGKGDADAMRWIAQSGRQPPAAAAIKPRSWNPHRGSSCNRSSIFNRHDWFLGASFFSVMPPSLRGRMWRRAS